MKWEMCRLLNNSSRAVVMKRSLEQKDVRKIKTSQRGPCVDFSMHGDNG